jgi:hypothetical protein
MMLLHPPKLLDGLKSTHLPITTHSFSKEKSGLINPKGWCNDEMIINVSRSQFFQQCRRKQYFYDQGLVQLGLAEPLVGGSAYHKGAAVLTATRNRDAALAEAEQYYRDELAKVKFILPEEKVLHERNIELVKRMLNAQADQYVTDTWTVLKPEVEFLVDLPGTEHHCHFIHRLLHPTSDSDVNVLAPAGCTDSRCVIPHKLRGKTDAVLSWNSLIWIMERKTSGMKQNIFWDQWYLSHQLSAYVYGVRKSTNLPVNGVILEKMPKPAKNQDPFSFNYSPEREPYLRSESDLAEFESEISSIATDYERAATIGKSAFYRNPQSCIDYNRRCDYWDTCKRGGTPNPGEFRQRDQDYVEAAYYTLLGMENPVASTSAVSQKSV